jgi:pimeloyl-ACP methyl ester carboxylesterase
MDIYSPGNDGKRRPALLFVHGGGFFFGDKNNLLQEELTADLIDRGLVVASMNYRLGTGLRKFDDLKKAIYCGVQDVRAALRYLTYYADHLGIDAERIYLSGSSAGGIIALTAAFMDEDEIFECCNKRKFKKQFGGLDESGNGLDCTFRIAGVVSLWGGLTDLSMIDGRNNMPALLFHGTEDNILYNDRGTPFQDYVDFKLAEKFFGSEVLYGSYAVSKRMSEQNMPVKYVPFEGYGHAPHLGKDGSFNRNINIIKQEMSDFCSPTRRHTSRSYNLSGFYSLSFQIPDTTQRERYVEPGYREALNEVKKCEINKP